jgi:hypothetical protein
MVLFQALTSIPLSPYAVWHLELMLIIAVDSISLLTHLTPDTEYGKSL